MRGTSRTDAQLWDAANLAGDLVPKGSVFAFLAEHRRELFPDSFIADLFSSHTGRPSLSADVIGSVLVLKELYGLSDPQTAEALNFDLRWKVACGFGVNQTGFHPSTLVYWRRRLAASAQPHRVFDKVAEVIGQTGLLKGRRRRLVDSTVFADAVATQDTITQLVAAMRKVARQVPGAAEVIADRCTLDYGKAGKPDIDWDDEQAKNDLVSVLVNDALSVLAAYDAGSAHDAGSEVDGVGGWRVELEEQAQQALAMLALVAGQDVEPADDSDGTDGRWKIARKVAADRQISTVDPQARHSRKSRSNRVDGYRGHVASEPETGLITDVEMTMACGEGTSDADMGTTFTGRDRYHHTASTGDEDKQPADEQPADEQPADEQPAGERPAGEQPAGEQPAGEQPADEQGLEVFGDSAYGSGEARAWYRQHGHDTVIKPKPLRPAVPGGFTLDDFAVNEQAGTVTCPNGVTKTMTASRSVTFGAVCGTCPLRAQCTTAKTGRSLTLHLHHDLLQAARVQARTEQFKQDYPIRSNIERTIAHLARQNGRRLTLRYIGTAKNNAWLHDRAAAVNLRNLIGKGLTRLGGRWAIQPV